MVGRFTFRQTSFVGFALLLATLTVAPPAAAQSSSGTAAGVVKDAKGTPVEGATVVFVSAESARKVETKTNKKGEFQQIGLAPGTYTVSASKGELVAVPSPATITSNQTMQSEIFLLDKKTAAAAVAGASASASADAAKVAEFTTAFDAGVAASGAGKPDDAIEKFNQAIALSAQCKDCYNNIGYAYVQKKDYDKAEEAYKKANEIKPSAASYNGLASVYTAQKKFDLATDASTKAAELSAVTTAGATGGNADALFNQGVTLWNSGKIEEAKKQFQAAVQANPNHAEAHYQLGMALVNEGSLAAAKAEFEAYVKLAPQGPNIAIAKSLLDSLK